LEIHEAIDHELSQIHRLTPSPSPARHLLSHARAIVVRIKEQQSRLAWISETTMIDRPAFDLVQTICFFNCWTADPTINGKIFSLAETAILFANHAFRLLAFSNVRK
jgi:hypothetical protein